jgi:hypothetical protein
MTLPAHRLSLGFSGLGFGQISLHCCHLAWTLAPAPLGTVGGEIGSDDVLYHRVVVAIGHRGN